jgi:hypothetical protein
MTTEEIKENLKIDIKIRNRTELYIYLRSIYINQEFKKGISLQKIANSLDLKNHSTIINIIKKTKVYKLDPLFMFIEKAYKTKDASYIKEYKNHQIERRKEQIKIDGLNYYMKKKIVDEDNKEFVYKKPEHFKKPHILEVAKNLRNINTDLNNKVYTTWNNEDFKKYYKLCQN